MSLRAAMLLVLLSAAACSRAPAAYEGANVLLITIDTLRSDHVSSYGYARPTTPNLDGLAAEGIRFADAVSVSSWTLPAHASMLTGLYPAEHGVETDINALPPSANSIAEILFEHGYTTGAAVSHVYLSRRWGFHVGFEHFDERQANGSPHRPVAAAVVDSGIGWLAGRDASRPFFLWLHVFDPHWDYSPPPPFDTLYDPHYRGAMTGDYASLAPYIRATAAGEAPPPLSARDLEHLRALYDGEISYVDRELGRLFEELRARGQWDETLVVVASDHGEEFMEHGSLEGHQWTLFDEVVRVPLLWKLPGSERAGRVVQNQVSNVSVTGTILDLIGIVAPSGRALPSVANLIDPSFRRGSAPEETALLDLTVRRRDRLLALRTPAFKLLRDHEGREALFAAPATRIEAQDVAQAEPEVVAAMSSALDRRLAELRRLSDAGVHRQTLDEATRERLRAAGYIQ